MNDYNMLKMLNCITDRLDSTFFVSHNENDD